MAEEDEVKQAEVRARLDVRMKEEFDKIMQHYGLSNESEGLRLCISHEYKRIKPEIEKVVVDKDLVKAIQELRQTVAKLKNEQDEQWAEIMRFRQALKLRKQ